MNNFYLGIDVSKGYSDFVLLDQKKQLQGESFQFDDTFTGHQQLYVYLSDLFTVHQKASLYAAVESTGGFENNWHRILSQYREQFPALHVSRINPYGVHMHGKADLKRIKTDSISARTIAEYLIVHPEKVSYQEEDYYASVRRQWTLLRLLVKQKVQLVNQLEAILYIANTELLGHCRDGIRLWMLRLLKHYPTARHLAKARVGTLLKIPYMKQELAEELIQGAKTSVASSVDDVTADTIRCLVDEIMGKLKVIALRKKKLEENCSIPEVALLCTFPGIATYSAIGLMIEIGTVSRFAGVKQLACYFGVHPVFSQSGDKTGNFHMSKKGRKEPRQILFTITKFAIVHNPLIKEIYAGHLQKGMSKMAAIGALMHKILRIIYGMLKHNQPFNPDIDRRNRSRSEQVRTTSTQRKKLKFRPVNLNAPVSRRQNKIRKEQELTQKDNNTLYTGSGSRSLHFPVPKT
jgi:transposase